MTVTVIAEQGVARDPHVSSPVAADGSVDRLRSRFSEGVGSR